MTLRRQLLLASLLLLSLPWAGCQFVREMEGALRQGQEQSLQATAQAIAAVLGSSDTLLYPNPERRQAPPDKRAEIYAHPLAAPLIVDGYGDGWEEIPAARLSRDDEKNPLAVNYRAATRNGTLYLLLQVEDQRVIYHNPGISAQPNGDRLVLRTWRGNRRQEYVIASAAPGRVRASAAGPLQPGMDPGAIQGFWQDTAAGYNLELAMPLAYTGDRLGFYLVDSDGRVETLGNTGPLDSAAPPWLIYSPATLQQALAPFGEHGHHIQAVDRQHWLIADIAATDSKHQGTADTFWLLRLLYRSILSRGSHLERPPEPAETGRAAGVEIDVALAGKQASHRYRDPVHSGRTTLSAAAPIVYRGAVIGAVVVRQSSEEYLSLTDQAFSRLLGYSLLVLCAGAFGLLAYATLLSWRIGRLSRAARAARTALSEDGAVTVDFPRSRAADEIGELSRHYAELLAQLQEYNDYLRTLSRKLSHELRTPIAVIQTSLENLEQAGERQGETEVYVARARKGLQRLNSILTAMSEANRLEESIRGNNTADVDLVPLLREVFRAYESVYPAHVLSLDMQVETAVVTGVPELIVQALDKLMDNAASFCPAGGRIDIGLSLQGNQWELSVSNQGPPLPAALQERLFDPMVSMRERVSDQVHLGLGLHIVRLIAEFHRGRAGARNLPGNQGVCVFIRLPCKPPGPPPE